MVGAVGEGWPDGVDEDGEIQRDYLTKEGAEACLSKVASLDVGSYFDSAQPKLFDPREFRDGEADVLERHRAQAIVVVGALGHHASDSLVEVGS
jgi:hypothetical protein